MKLFTTILIFICASSAYSADRTKVSFTMPSFNVSFDKSFAQDNQGKQLTVLYVEGDRSFTLNDWVIKNIVHSSAPINISDLNEGLETFVPSKTVSYTFDTRTSPSSLLNPYNFVVFIVHNTGKLYWVNSTLKDDSEYYIPHVQGVKASEAVRAQVSRTLQRDLIRGAARPLVHRVDKDSVDTNLCISPSSFDCTAAKVNLTKSKFQER